LLGGLLLGVPNGKTAGSWRTTSCPRWVRFGSVRPRHRWLTRWSQRSSRRKRRDGQQLPECDVGRDELRGRVRRDHGQL